jgi:hypothetical protein
MTIYKVITNLVHSGSQERVPAGAFVSNEGTYNADEGIQEISTGDAQANLRQAPPPILLRPSYLAGKTQREINSLLGYALESVDNEHDDYARLVEFGVIKTKKKKIALPKTATEGID